ncbi:MAG: hypothetical protein H0V82_04515 [Candidatus Protochlamydia sp.]|nr:hypothetical protein [Candidatus Protochlamydia sp.]
MNNFSVNPMPNLDLKNILIQKILNTTTTEQLDEISMEEYKDDVDVLQVRINKERSISQLMKLQMSEIKRQNEAMVKSISTIPFMLDGKEITELEFRNRILKQIPPNTYLQIKVTNLSQYQFATPQPKRARKIELIREEWGTLNVPLCNGFTAFFSSLAIRNSIYREIIIQNTLMNGILASSTIFGDIENDINENSIEKSLYYKQISAAYWSGKKIEIIVPFDFSEEGVVWISSDSLLLSFNIDSGRWIRSFFTNT